VTAAFPLVRRAMKVLSEREVTPQLGLLKSTLLQLDSTFSEKSYGAGSFRDFAEKLAQAGLIRLNQSGRNLLVDIKDEEPAGADEAQDAQPPAGPQPSDRQHHERHRRDRRHGRHDGGAPQPEREVVPDEQPHEEAAPRPPAPGEALAVQQAEAIAMLRRAIEGASLRLRWPMYVRNVKQLLRATESNFDERRYGFGGILDLLRASQRDGILRLERDRQGVLRVFQGQALLQPPAAPIYDVANDEPAAVHEAVAGEQPGGDVTAEPTQAPTETGEAAMARMADSGAAEAAPVAAPGETEGVAGEPTEGRSRRRRGAGVVKKSAAPKKPRAAAAKPRGRKKENAKEPERA
jgi:hypothetical protein